MKTEQKIKNAINELKSSTFATRKHAVFSAKEIAAKHKIKGLLVNESENGKVISAIGWTSKIKVTE